VCPFGVIFAVGAMFEKHPTLRAAVFHAYANRFVLLGMGGRKMRFTVDRAVS